MEKFYLENYVKQDSSIWRSSKYDFKGICHLIDGAFRREWEEQSENVSKMLEIQKKAIIGYETEVSYFKEKIRTLVKKYDAEDVKYPAWYQNLEEGIYHENWGLAGIAEWFQIGMQESSSAKIIGERIYFLEHGKMVLKPQKILKNRREQLIRAFLLLTPEERLDRDFHEIYMLDGSRVTIFGGSMVKENQDVIVFRRYVIPNLTFEEQARRGTIPEEAIPLFEDMVALGYNVAFTGAMRTGKSTFLSTWQSYEDESLEGVMVETDPELPLHKIMERAPIVQLLANGEKLKDITKNLLRSDADYIIMAEARDGLALDTAIKIAAKGTRRVKITFHSRDPMDFPYDVAGEVVKSLGGDLHYTARRVAASFDYIFHFIQLTDKSKKRLKSIYEMSLDKQEGCINLHPICQYSFAQDRWAWENHISHDKEDAGMEENRDIYSNYAKRLSKLTKMSMQKGETHA